MHDLFPISAKHNRIQCFILGHLYSAQESEGNRDQYRLYFGTRAARPTTFRFTGSFEISEARILTPIRRTPDRAARYSVTDDTNSRNRGAKLVAFYIFSLFYTKRNIEYNW
jgi:hypothetical protein